MSAEKSYRRHFLTILSGNTISQAIPFLIAPLITRIFTKDEIGASANWLALVGLIGVVATGRLEMAIPLPKSNKEARFIFSSGLVITLFITLLSCIVLFFAKDIALWYEDPSLEQYIWLIPFGVLSIGLLGLTSNWALRHRRYTTVSYGKIAQSLLNNLGAVLLGYIAFGTMGLIVAWIVSQFVNAFVMLDKTEFSRKLWTSHFNFTFFKKTLKKYKEFPLINSLHAFTDMFATQFFLFYLITVYFSTEELAMFALLTRYVKAPIVLVSSAVSQLYYIEAGKLINNEQSGVPMAMKTLKTVTIFAIPFILILLFFGPTIFEFYLGKEWREAGVYAQRFAPMFFLFFFVSPLSGTPLLFNKQKTAFLLSVIGYIFSLGSIAFGHFSQWNFIDTLTLYSISFSGYYLVLLLWYLKLLKKDKKHA